MLSISSNIFVTLENLFNLLGGNFRKPAHFGWGVGSIVASVANARGCGKQRLQIADQFCPYLGGNA
jgi:hypothetical protein